MKRIIQLGFTAAAARARILYSALAWFAALGLFLSIVCHLLSWARLTPPGGQAAFLLHLGIFVVWVPLVFCANRTKPGGGRGNVDHLLEPLPRWVGPALSGVFAYAFISFFVFMAMTRQYPKHSVPAWLELRGFSGHWMLFYSVALAGFVGLKRLKKNNDLSSR